ncbi:hypothetical protein FV222_00395 [Methylobacterium sp. WL103]|uniref:hypothetical protein n=1 Tax=Methylobacterium sp. WL103 TaxID=2603891 RepID=UPI0011C87C9D|nr:hypothetical protein [Methylobacterium sp. WL103]TXN08964.1 hypothetical protein FV222_00395 [Methylobacterium sp. WL103]
MSDDPWGLNKNQANTVVHPGFTITYHTQPGGYGMEQQKEPWIDLQTLNALVFWAIMIASEGWCFYRSVFHDAKIGFFYYFVADHGPQITFWGSAFFPFMLALICISVPLLILVKFCCLAIGINPDR